MTTEECTDGTIDGWPCAASITGDRITGYDLKTAPYTDENDNSAPHEIALKIADCWASFMTIKACRNFAIARGFVPDGKWGEMK
jgi:hypothetical protein